MMIELTYNWGKGTDAYTKGDAYAQIAISTEVIPGLDQTLAPHPIFLLCCRCRRVICTISAGLTQSFNWR